MFIDWLIPYLNTVERLSFVHGSPPRHVLRELSIDHSIKFVWLKRPFPHKLGSRNSPEKMIIDMKKSDKDGVKVLIPMK